MYKEMITNVYEGFNVEDTDDFCRRINTLKDMGFIARDTRVEINGGYVEYAGVLIDDEKKWENIMNDVMKNSSILTQEEEMEQMKETIKVGAEFTFHRNDFNFSMEDLQSSTGGTHPKDIEAANEEIKKWTNKIIGLQGENVKGVYVSSVKTSPQSDKKHSSPKYKAVKLQLALEIGGNTETWWINFDLDPSCIEIQTEPKSYVFYETYINCINEIIFRYEGCKPEKDPKHGGGGHISLDYASAFLDTPYYLKNFLVLYASKVKKVQNDAGNRFQKLTESQDEDNAPFMHEIGELDDFIINIRWFNGLSQKEATVGTLANKINTVVYKKMTSTLSGMGVKGGDAKHYQAVNLEHLNPDNPEGKRVEMRRFDAQIKVDELLEELELLYDLIQESRTYFKQNINRNSYDVVMDNIGNS